MPGFYLKPWFFSHGVIIDLENGAGSKASALNVIPGTKDHVAALITLVFQVFFIFTSLVTG